MGMRPSPDRLHPRLALPFRNPQYQPMPAARRRSVSTRAPARPEAIAAAVLAWFPTVARDLPWRRTTDPYAVWIAEIMLQQTQVKTVIPYWERWMRELPTLATLADAAEERVLKLWEGLGYYSRVRNSQRAARAILAHPHARFPKDAPALLELPGIGRYTAGAVASIAFNEPAPILDGNVIRVLARLFALGGDPRSPGLNHRLWEISGEIVTAASRLPPPPPPPRGSTLRFAGNCSLLNQGLMELGATVCTPTQPVCPACPLVTICRAYALRRTADFPGTADRPTMVPQRFATVLWTHRGRWLVRRRPAGEVNAGFWEFPNELIGADADAAASLSRWLGVAVAKLVPAGRIRHTITHHRITQEPFRLECPPTRVPPAGEVRWVTMAELSSLPLTAAHRRLARRLGDRPLPN